MIQFPWRVAYKVNLCLSLAKRRAHVGGVFRLDLLTGLQLEHPSVGRDNLPAYLFFLEKAATEVQLHGKEK